VRVAGSANAVRIGVGGRTYGGMFDGEGFVRGVLRKGRRLEGESALVVGAGGVGSAIAASLARAGVARLMLFDADGGAADRLASRIAAAHPGIKLATGSADPYGHGVVVNATPLGMAEGDPLPVNVDRLAPHAFVGEVVMRREMTDFLLAARARGCVVQTGLDMLFEQIPAYLDFFGLPPATPETLRFVARLPERGA
jgi:shikimate dehydrogenase